MTVQLSKIEVEAEAVDALNEAITDADGFPPLSEHKALRLDGSDDARVTAWGQGGELVALSVAAWHEGDDPHWALEVATGARMRSDPFEQAAIAAGASTIPPDEPSTLWVQRDAQRKAAEALGYSERRRLLRMAGPLPAAAPSGDATFGTIADTRDDELIAVHNRAFAGHPEASGMNQRRLDELRAMPWFDPAGVITTRVDGELAGFCWTKLHPNGDGEVYLLAVDPTMAGRGLGERLGTAGFSFLRDRGAKRAMLWVDAANEAAVSLYRRIGLAAVHANVEMAPPGESP